MTIEELANQELQKRLSNDDAQKQIEKKVNTAVNKVVNNYFHHDPYYPEQDGEGFHKIETEVMNTIKDQKDHISALIDQYVNDAIEDRVRIAVKHVINSDLMANRMEKLAKPIIKEQIDKAFSERDTNADYENVKKKVETKINAQMRTLVGKIKISF